MKTFNLIMKILAVLAALAGITYVIVRYGDKIVAWVREMVDRYCPKLCTCGCDCDCGCDCAEDADFEG